MAKLITDDLVSLENQTTAISTINQNFTAVEAAIENTLSRDGTSPNAMGADLDMNSHDILNLSAPSGPTSPVRVQDLETYIDQINGTGSGVIASPTLSEVNRIAKATAAGVVGFGQVEIDSSHNIHPTTTDVGALGTSSKMWADAFLASGAVINFNNGNYTVTHSAGNLAFSGTLGVTGVLTATAGVRPLANDGAALGSASLSWADLFLASGAVINFNNGNLTLTHAAGQITNSGNWINTGTMTVTSTSTLTGNVGIGQATAAGARAGIAAGTTTIAPVKLTSGTNLTSPAAGAVEYDGASLFYTNETTAGRGLVPVTQHFKLTSDGSAISTIANFFGANSNIPLVSGGHYLIEIEGWFLKTTAGTHTITLTNSAAPTNQNIYYEMSPVTGIVAPPGTATMLVGQYVKDATAARTIVTGSLTTAVNHYFYIRIHLYNNTGTSLQIQSTASAGTITPLTGSWWRCTRLPTSNTGSFAA